jgi:Flp pilus assembly pilin Flp
MRKLIRNRKGQGLVEYALIIAGVALIGIVGITMFGHKVADLIGTVAMILPGAHTDDNAPIVAGHLIETDNNGPSNGGAGSIEINLNGVTADNGSNRINEMLLGSDGGADSTLVTETNTAGQTGGGGGGG